MARSVSAGALLAHDALVERRRALLRQAEARRAAAVERFSREHGYRVTLRPEQAVRLARQEVGL